MKNQILIYVYMEIPQTNKNNGAKRGTLSLWHTKLSIPGDTIRVGSVSGITDEG